MKLKKVGSIMLVLTMVLTSLSGTAKEKQVEAAMATSTANNDLSNPSTDSDGVTSWDSVYFGSYWQSDTNGDGFADKNDEKTPIQWRVLSVENDEVLLLADKCLEYQPFHNEADIDGITWETCSLRKWLNKDFYDTAFTDDEKGAIIKKTLSNESENRKFASCNDTQDNVALLSWDEAYKEEYAITDSRINLEMKRTDYAASGLSGGFYVMCTRSCDSKGYVIGVTKPRGSETGYISTRATNNISIRPIVHIKKSSSLWKKAAVIHNFEMDYEPTEPTETPTKGKLSTNIPVVDDSKIVHSGKDGDISWSINASGCLKLEGNGDWKGLADSFIIAGDEEARIPKWLDYSDDIIMAQINVTGMTNCKYMFDGCSNLIKLEANNWDTSKVTDMGYMFRYCEKLQSLDDIEKMNTANVKNMDGMFYGCKELSEINLSNFDTSNVTNMWGMFGDCSNLEEIDLSSFSTSKLESMVDMFDGCDMLKKLDISSFDLRNCKRFSGFYGLYNLVEIETPFQLQDVFDEDDLMDGSLPRFTSNYTPWKDKNGNMYERFPIENESIKLTRKIVHPEEFQAFSGVSGNLKWSVDIEGKLTIVGDGECKKESADYPGWHSARRYIKSCVVDVEGVTDASYMFADLPYLEKIELDNFDTSQIVDMSLMFYGDFSLKSLDVSGFDTANVESMDYMFMQCSSLKELDLTCFQTNKTGSFSYMFYGCHSLEKIELFRLGACNCTSMFQECFNLKELQLGEISANELYGVFKCCHNLTNLDLGSWDMTGVSEYNDYSDNNITGWPTFWDGTASLTQIKTPVNLKVEVKLPEGNWTDESGKSYTALPVNESESLLLTKSEDPLVPMPTPTPTVKPTPTPTVNFTPVPTKSPSPTVTSAPTNTPSVSGKPVSVANAKVEIKSVKNKKSKKAVISWKKVTGASGYQIVYSTSKKFKSKKTKNVTKATVTLSKLKKKKTYYIKVRAYTKVNGKKVYGKWSTVKKVKIKK